MSDISLSFIETYSVQGGTPCQLSPKESWLEEIGKIMDAPIDPKRWQECWEYVLKDIDVVKWSRLDEEYHYLLELKECYKVVKEGEDDIYIPKKMHIRLAPDEQSLYFESNSLSTPSGFCGRGSRKVQRLLPAIPGSGIATRTHYNAKKDQFETSSLLSTFKFPETRTNSYQHTLEIWGEAHREGIGEQLPENFFPGAQYL